MFQKGDEFNTKRNRISTSREKTEYEMFAFTQHLNIKLWTIFGIRE